jgi:glycosyltransferase involved in cell wall biosynthesis
MKIAILTTDNRENFREYTKPAPYFGTAPEALLQGFAGLPGVEVHIISCTQRPMQCPEKLAGNIWFHSLLVAKIGWLRTGYQGCIRAVRRKLREIQPDIVHGQGTERDCAISAVLSGFPNVLTIHGNMAELARLFKVPIGSYDWLAARLENFVLPRTAGVFCNSAYTESLVRPRARQGWRVPNALREAFFLKALPAGNKFRGILLHVGVVCENKQQLKMLEVARSLHRRKLDFEMHFIGPANTRDAYVRNFLNQVRAVEETEGYARYLGNKSVEELIGCFDRASALVHTPVCEAFGLVVAEALARNLKLFGMRVGGVTDIAEGVPDAELFAENDWAGLTDAMARWIQQGHPRLSGAATVMQKRYRPEIITRRHVEIYREVLSAARHTAGTSDHCDCQK